MQCHYTLTESILLRHLYKFIIFVHILHLWNLQKILSIQMMKTVRDEGFYIKKKNIRFASQMHQTDNAVNICPERLDAIL